MSKCVLAILTFAAAFISALPGAAVYAAEIKVLSVGALRSTTDELIPEFEKATGHKVNIESGAAGAMATRIERGESVDVIVVTTPLLEDLLAKHRVLADTTVVVARSGMGIATRRDGDSYDVSTLEAFKHTLQAVRSIGQANPASGASSAIYSAKLLAGMDVASELRAKTKLFASGPLLYEAIAKGDVELGFGQKTEILADPRVKLVGPLPAPVQNISEYSAAVVATTNHSDVARAFIVFLTSPGAVIMMQSKGFE